MERLWRKVLGRGTDGCWLWQGGTAKGYGVIRLSQPRRMIYVHRLSWELANGPIPDGMKVLHTCDTPRCVNPDHLWLGTHTDNMRDMHRKGRANQSRPGERNGRAKLTRDQAEKIRARYAAGGISQAALGAEYGVDQRQVSQIVLGRSWR